MDNFKIYKVGTFNESQIKNGDDKKAIEKAQQETGIKYVNAYFNKKKQVLDIYLGNDFNL